MTNPNDIAAQMETEARKYHLVYGDWVNERLNTPNMELMVALIGDQEAVNSQQLATVGGVSTYVSQKALYQLGFLCLSNGKPVSAGDWTRAPEWLRQRVQIRASRAQRRREVTTTTSVVEVEQEDRLELTSVDDGWVTMSMPDTKTNLATLVNSAKALGMDIRIQTRVR